MALVWFQIHCHCPPGGDPHGLPLIFEDFIFETHDTLYSDFYSKNKLRRSDIMSEKKPEKQNNEQKLAKTI